MTPGTFRKSDETLRVLTAVADSHSPAAFACSFGAEDMVIVDLIAGAGLAIEVFTLDTGRLPEETFDLIAEVRLRYPIFVRVLAPVGSSVESYVERNGPNAFYDSVAQRRECCQIRKVEPLGRALQGKKAWVTGLRHEQAATREKIELKSWDGINGLWKFNPLLDWSIDELWNYIRDRNVPYNKLHDDGYPSIGCTPCTRAIVPGEDLRAGRWWWGCVHTQSAS